MDVSVNRHALDRVPLSIIFDDSTMLVNLNYFFLRDAVSLPVAQAPFISSWKAQVGNGGAVRWEDVPVVHPESFTREFARFCLDHGVRGKFSVVPCPAALGRIDEGLDLFSQGQQESWLQMCREMIMPNFDITPEMMTHTFVVDLEALQPVDVGLWEQWGWNHLPTDQPELVTDYIALACEILHNVGLTPTGVTSPGGFGSPLEFYAACAKEAVHRVTGNPTPFFFKRGSDEEPVPTPVWYADRDAGTAMGEIFSSTDDRTGSWTGYGEVDADHYITADLRRGRMADCIDAGEPAVMISHWQGFYGMHDDDRAGFDAFKTVVGRLEERDPRGEYCRWRKCSEITNYACAAELCELSVEGGTIRLDLPVRVPEFTLRITDTEVRSVSVDGRLLTEASTRTAFGPETFLCEDGVTFVAFDPAQRAVVVTVEV
ncbi:MAG TPA: hypothetical protein QGF95_24375 [Candidatus Latescibacteria bacterium]|jgi:hypothetical protein|nr:hypothetical protein [Gemmatimonadaceae bacterium]MDP6017332.1 hypothetical protein [Candidatus Latescibacterota bacterium]HJP33702.1 hypothetical protein [Candidatus Latescibacterota bacterium]